ncbi:class I SAM-dependent methyltransferase [bacterium]|nr:class I SAM-dependent methyltransferase [bacterium]
MINLPTDVPIQHIDSPIDQADFERFEADIAAFVEARDSIYCHIPQKGGWHSFLPDREKLLEYYLTMQAIQFGPKSVYMDVASCMSLFPNYVAERFGSTVIRQDLFYEPGLQFVDYPRIDQSSTKDDVRIAALGSNGSEMSLASDSIDAITLHCSFEHFEGDSDSRFMQEALRILRPGGRILVIPFYIGGEHQEIVQQDQVSGCQFHRYYSYQSFVDRVLSKLDADIRIEFLYYPNHKEIDPAFYCCYSMCIVKQ